MASARAEDRSDGDRSRRAPPAGAPRQAGSPAQGRRRPRGWSVAAIPTGACEPCSPRPIRSVLRPASAASRPASPASVPRAPGSKRGAPRAHSLHGTAGRGCATPCSSEGRCRAMVAPPPPPATSQSFRQPPMAWGCRPGEAAVAGCSQVAVARRGSRRAAWDGRGKSAGAGPRSRASAGRPPGVTNGRPDVRDKAPCVRRCPRGSPGARWSALAVGSGRPAVRLRPPNAPARAWSAIAALSGERAAIALPGAAGGKPDPPRLRRFFA